MRELVFANDSAKKRLEAILHPLILAQARQEAAQPSDAPYALVVVPLLFESGRYRDWLQRVITVDCPEETQIARATQRSRLDAAAVRAIMARQLDRRERARLADEIIHNEGTLEDLQKQVDALHGRLVALATESD